MNNSNTRRRNDSRMIRRRTVPVAPTPVDVVVPRARVPIVRTMKPVYTGTNEGIRIAHAESIPIASYANVRIVVTSDTLTWVRNIAECFEEWRIKFQFEWVPTCAATTDGAVRLAWDYDPLEAAFTSMEEYFNMADHLVQSVWMHGGINTRQSAWLKTGRDGFPREYSPGAIHAYIDPSKGYLLARYVVEFRGAQPNAADHAIYTGTFAGTGDLFNFTSVTGNRNLIDITSGSQITQTGANRLIVVWSTDSSAGTYTQGGSGLGLGVSQDAGIRTVATWYTNADTNTLTFTRATAPGGATAFKLAIFTISHSPVYV